MKWVVVGVVVVGALAQSAWAKQYSSGGGCPASGVTAERAKSVARGGVSVSTTTTYRDAQGRLQGTKD